MQYRRDMPEYAIHWVCILSSNALILLSETGGLPDMSSGGLACFASVVSEQGASKFMYQIAQPHPDSRVNLLFIQAGGRTVMPAFPGINDCFRLLSHQFRYHELHIIGSLKHSVIARRVAYNTH